ncbi:MAG: winged helix-turn-helix transcriptional regulator [Candidatus Aenigmarchaeota archaeon]|nr:winged helix-turn-helix transcriptional regulator [Candidatus Aenigmarchaeota archaeon]
MQPYKLFRALASETRLKILEKLLKADLCVTNLAELMRKDKSTISRHLKVLSNAKIIEIKKRGKEICFKVRNRKKLKKIIELARRW